MKVTNTGGMIMRHNGNPAFAPAGGPTAPRKWSICGQYGCQNASFDERMTNPISDSAKSIFFLQVHKWGKSGKGGASTQRADPNRWPLCPVHYGILGPGLVGFGLNRMQLRHAYVLQCWVVGHLGSFGFVRHLDISFGGILSVRSLMK
jgi:hypothetical protein